MAAVVSANWAPAMSPVYRGTGARCSSIHNLMGWNEGAAGDRNEDALDKRGQGIRRRLTMTEDGEPCQLRWLILEEVGAISPTTFRQIENELRQYSSKDGRRGMHSWAGLNVVLLDPVGGQHFWKEDASTTAQIGIDLLRREFSKANMIELTEQCRVLDPEYEEHVLRPLRLTDEGPTKRGLEILRSRVIKARDRATLKKLNAAGTRLVAYCNSQKCDHMRSRAQEYAATARQRLYWSVAEDWLSGEGTRRAWAERDDLAQQKRGWLALDDMKCARRMGCLPLAVGMPVRLNDHLNRQKGLVAGLRGTIKQIWFDGDPPSKESSDGEYICAKVPIAVVVRFDGFPEEIPVPRSAKRWEAGAARTATGIRRLQLPLVPDYGSTAHLAQGSTMPTALVELNMPSSGDATAAYVALSRVRRREDLYILRDFDSTKLRRSGSKAAVDILLQRLRGDLADNAEGTKECMAPRCRKQKPRSAFVSRETKSTRQWLSRDRRCLDCLALDKRERDEALRHRAQERRSKGEAWSAKHVVGRRKCHGDGCAGALCPRDAFSPSQRDVPKPKCIECLSGPRSPTRKCHGACGKSITLRPLSACLALHRRLTRRTPHVRPPGTTSSFGLTPLKGVSSPRSSIAMRSSHQRGSPPRHPRRTADGVEACRSAGVSGAGIGGLGRVADAADVSAVGDDDGPLPPSATSVVGVGQPGFWRAESCAPPAAHAASARRCGRLRRRAPTAPSPLPPSPPAAPFRRDGALRRRLRRALSPSAASAP
eukprot:gene57382-biopygen58260